MISTTIQPPRASPSTERNALRVARRFYEFWDTGEASALRKAIAPSFIDHTPPPGHSQGPKGVLQSSRALRAAVPDLRCEVEELIAAGNRVTARLRFRGTFTGVCGQVQGDGQPVDFVAISLVRVRGGLVTDNWHLEDNLKLMRQLGAARRGRQASPLV